MHTNKGTILNTFIFLPLLAALFLTGCGSSSGSGSESNAVIAPFYDSSKASIGNLLSVDSTYSAYNGVNALPIRTIPTDSKEVWYACTVTNPQASSISNVTLTPPLVYSSNAKASYANKANSAYSDENKFDLCCNIKNLRENPLTKAKLKDELKNKYLIQKAENKKGVRAAISHASERKGQLATIIILGKRRSCRLAKISTYGKFFVDQESHGTVPAPVIGDEVINDFATEFDTYIYPILRDNFSNGENIFWNDVDNDKKLSIVFSPVYNNYGDGVAGIFDSSSLNDQSYARDVIGISVKSEDTEFAKWFMDARETIAHEMQHIINHSAKDYESEEAWIDEGLAVCAEILYRKTRGEQNLMTYSPYYGGMHRDFAGNDQRFFYSSYVMPELSVISFNENSGNLTEVLAHYGQKGLFFYYLYEQYGAELIKKLCQGKSGKEKFSQLITDRTLEQLVIDFNFATLYEKLRNVNFTNLSSNPYNSARKPHRFDTNMNLNFITQNQTSYTEITEDYITSRLVSLEQKSVVTLLSNEVFPLGLPKNGGTFRFFFKQPKNFSNLLHNSYYTLTFSSSAPVVVNIIRLF